MRQKLSDESRKRMEAAGPCDASEFRDLKPASVHEELFFEYFADSCDNEEARRTPTVLRRGDRVLVAPCRVSSAGEWPEAEFAGAEGREIEEEGPCLTTS